jgi:hypothetical protein
MCKSLNIDLRKYYNEKTTPIQVTSSNASAYSSLTSLTSLSHATTRILYKVIRNKSIHNWRANSLWDLFNKRLDHKDFKRLRLKDVKTLIIGAGPCGLRLSIELALLGLKVIVIEKRDGYQIIF